MPHKDLAFKIEALSKRATQRRITHPAIKTSIDVEVENQNFSEQKDYIYKKIAEER